MEAGVCDTGATPGGGCAKMQDISAHMNKWHSVQKHLCVRVWAGSL